MAGTPRRRDASTLLATGTAVVLTGDWLAVAAQAVKIAQRARHHNGAPPSESYRLLGDALTAAVSAAGLPDVRLTPALRQLPYDNPTVPIERVAEQLGVGIRQARRQAPKLGGRKIDGKWFCDELAVREHVTGKENE